MRATADDLYAPREIALAAGVPEADVIAALGGARGLVGRADAVRVGRALVSASEVRPAQPQGGAAFFSMFSATASARRSVGVPIALSSTLHLGLIACGVFLATFNLSPRAAALRTDDRPGLMRLVFLATPGPGGGGGGGGLVQQAPPPKALREGRRATSSPLPVRREPTPIMALPKPTEPFPTVVAPIISAPADARNRMGVLELTPVESQTHGPGNGGGAGDGSGIGPGSGGGIGGGPYRPGSGIEAPTLAREVKADYTEDARRRGISGDVVLEIVVRRDDSVGDVRVLQGLAGGLSERAADAVRQWRFIPTSRLGVAVDVIVEVAVEFKLR